MIWICFGLFLKKKKFHPEKAQFWKKQPGPPYILETVRDIKKLTPDSDSELILTLQDTIWTDSEKKNVFVQKNPKG